MQTESFEHVTNRQGVQLAQKARECNVTRSEFKKFLDNPKKLQEFFGLLKTEDSNWFRQLKSEANKINLRVHLISRLRVDYTKTYKKALMDGGPQTPSGYSIIDANDKPSNEIVEEIIVLLNNPQPQGDGNYFKIVEWGLANGLDKTISREIFSVGEHFPDLNYTLGSKIVCVVGTNRIWDGSSDYSETYCVDWCYSMRECGLHSTKRLGRANDWFAFRKEI